MAEPKSNLSTRINPTTPQKQVAAFGVELDKLLYRFGCEFDIEPEEYAAALMQAAEDILHHEMQEVPGFAVRILDGPLAGEVCELDFPDDYHDQNVLYWATGGYHYRLYRLASGAWQGMML